MLLPVVGAFVYVRLFGVDITFGDAWTMVPLFEKLSLGTLDFGDLWKQHWEHRVLFPRVALLLVGVATGWNNVAVMYLNQAGFVVTVIVLFLAFRGGGAKPGLLLFVPIPFLVLNLAQYFNVFHSFQLALVFAQVFGVLALYMLYLSRSRSLGRLAFAGALVSGVVASFSLGPGLFVWLAGFLQLLISPTGRITKKIFLAVWGLVGAVCWVLYFHGLVVPDRQKGSYFLDDLSPLRQAEWLFMALGSPLAWRPGLVSTGALALPSALICGMVLAGLVAVSLFFVYKARKLGEHSFWVGLLFFGLLCTASIALARSGGPLEWALESRYITFTGLVAVGAYGLLARLATEGGSRAVAASLGVMIVLLVAGLPFSYAYGIRAGEMLEAKKERELAAFSSYSSQPNEALEIANRHSGYIRNNGFILCKLGYSVFSDPKVRAQNCLPPDFSSLSPVEGSTTSRVISLAGIRVNGREEPIVIPRGKSSIRVVGQALDAPNGKPAGGVFIRVDDELFPAFYGRSRGYSGTGINVPVLNFSRFERAIPISRIGPGEHELSIVVVTNDRKGYYRPGEEITFRVRPL
jgi:hypothetical protein